MNKGRDKNREREEHYMRRAIALARRGEGRVNPNPLVGAVIVREDRVLGEGWHDCYGGLHAERNAFASLQESAAGATLYVTLEPCCHQGKQPPCVDAILEQGITRVVIGSRDPNPLVAGGGVRRLREAGVLVEEDFLREECDALNPVFFHYITTHRPYVAMKYAMTADGKIATRTGASQWITGESARRRVQEYRNRYRAILAGIGTVLADDPLLTCRLPQGRNPIRILCDSALRIPLSSRICQTAREVPTIVVWAGEGIRAESCSDEERRLQEKRQALQELGIQVLSLPDENGRIALPALMERLGELGIDSVLLEGGGTLNDSALRSGIVNHVHAFVAPKLFGGREAKTPVEGEGAEQVAQAIRLRFLGSELLDEDILLEYDVVMEHEQKGGKEAETCLQES